jgi:hypothetical protein
MTPPPQNPTESSQDHADSSTSSASDSHGTTVEPTDSGPDTEQPRLSKDEADRLYEERIEEEYAKREGGA